MLMRSWLSRWSAGFNASQNVSRKLRRGAVRPAAAQVQPLEPRVLLTVTAAGTEFQVNTFTTGAQKTSFVYGPHAVAMDSGGNFVVTWTGENQDGSSEGVYAQRFNATGVAQGSEFRVNTYTTGFQRSSSVAMDADGDFVITWTNNSAQDGSGSGIFAQRYSAAGVAQGTEVQVNTYTFLNQFESVAAMDADGDFVITWTDGSQEGAVNLGVYAQRFSAAGIAQGSEFHINSFTTGNQQYSDLAVDDDGDFVVTWTSDGQDGSDDGIYAQRYNASGVAQGSAFKVNTYTTGEQSFSKVAMDSDGDFIITWRSIGQDDGSLAGVYAQRYNASGVAQGSEFLVNTTTANAQNFPTVAVDDGGNFVIAWTSLQGGSNNIYGQLYNATGTAQGGEFQVNTYTTNSQDNASVAMDADGDFVVAWTSEGQDGDSSGVYGQRFVPNQAPSVSAQSFSISENRPIGHVVGTVSASDPDAGQSLTYSITAGNTGNVFSINSSTGQITVAAATINYEAINQYNLTVQVTDNGTPTTRSSSATITVNITDLNEAPTFLSPTTFSIAENRAIGYTVGDVNTVDPEGNTVTYSIVGGDPNAQFSIDSSTGVITVAKATIDYESTPAFSLSVKAQDNGSPANSRTQTITVNITDLNEAPTFLAPTTFSIAENRPVGYAVGDVDTVDPEGNTVTYSIVGGDPNAQFAIDSSTGEITVAKATINYEATPQFTLQVKAQDNGSPANSRTQNITVNITDLNEAPTFTGTTTFSIAENSANSTSVGTVTTVDPESNTVTYSITAGNTSNAFAINASTGQITVNNSAALDYETTPQFLLSVKAEDNGSPSNSRTQTITINLTDISGARVPRSKAQQSTSLTAAGLSGEQTVATSSGPAATVRKANADPESMFSFTLFEPLPSEAAASEL